MKNIGLVFAAAMSALAGAYLIHRHDGRFDDIGGFALLAFSLVCMAPASVHAMREEASAAWKSFKNPGGAT